MTAEKTSRPLAFYAQISVAAACATILLKGLAWHLTGSVALLSDALESFVNLAAALVALGLARLSEAPPDEEHPHGHGKAQFFSCAFEGALVAIAALAILAQAVPKFWEPTAPELPFLGIAAGVAASIVNLAVALFLRAEAQARSSALLEADARHLLSDVWTSAGVFAGLALFAATGWEWVDPLMACLFALLILRSGFGLLTLSFSGLMDSAGTSEQRGAVLAALEFVHAEGASHHRVLTRDSGNALFVSLHLLVPGAWTVQRSHDLAERVEASIRSALPGAFPFVHVEPAEDPASLDDPHQPPEPVRHGNLP